MRAGTGPDITLKDLPFHRFFACDPPSRYLHAHGPLPSSPFHRHVPSLRDHRSDALRTDELQSARHYKSAR